MPTHNNALCLDGPLNGQYASLAVPPVDYFPYEWPTGELCLLHNKGLGTLETQELMRFIEACRNDGRPEAIKLAEEAERRLSEREINE